MDIIELLRHVGAANVVLQPLHKSLVGARLTADDSEITFATERETGAGMLEGASDSVGIVAWIPKDRLPDEIMTAWGVR